MRYLMLVCASETVQVTPEEADAGPWVEEMDGRGVRIEGDRLRPIADATTVRDGGRLVTDGPFAETTEQIAGYDIIECADLDEAIEVASKHPVAKYGAIEVRPFWSD
jgi:hypothetical protein